MFDKDTPKIEPSNSIVRVWLKASPELRKNYEETMEAIVPKTALEAMRSIPNLYDLCKKERYDRENPEMKTQDASGATPTTVNEKIDARYKQCILAKYKTTITNGDFMGFALLMSADRKFEISADDKQEFFCLSLKYNQLEIAVLLDYEYNIRPQTQKQKGEYKKLTDEYKPELKKAPSTTHSDNEEKQPEEKSSPIQKIISAKEIQKNDSPKKENLRPSTKNYLEIIANENNDTPTKSCTQKVRDQLGSCSIL